MLRLVPNLKSQLIKKQFWNQLLRTSKDTPNSFHQINIAMSTDWLNAWVNSNKVESQRNLDLNNALIKTNVELDGKSSRSNKKWDLSKDTKQIMHALKWLLVNLEHKFSNRLLKLCKIKNNMLNMFKHHIETKLHIFWNNGGVIAHVLIDILAHGVELITTLKMQSKSVTAQLVSNITKLTNHLLTLILIRLILKTSFSLVLDPNLEELMYKIRNSLTSWKAVIHIMP